jgi:signal transduction histidine kinase
MDINTSEDDQINHLYKYAYIEEANEAWGRIGQFEDITDLIGTRLEEFLPRSIPENIAFLKELIRNQYRLDDFKTVEVYKTGAEIIAINSVAGIIDNGHLVQIWGSGRDITEQIKFEKELEESKKDLQRLAGRLIDNQEKELRRLSRELHDNITQKLAVLAIEVGSVEQQADLSDSALMKISSIKEQLISISKDIHTLSRDLHPSIIKDLGLEQALQAECNNFSSRMGLPVIVNTKNVPGSLPDDIALALYRIVQEGLGNAAAHAMSRNVYVFLEGLEESVVLMVRDTGIGFNLEKVREKTGLGLSSIQERVRLIGGELKIKTAEGKGTCIEVIVPHI